MVEKTDLDRYMERTYWQKDKANWPSLQEVEGLLHYVEAMPNYLLKLAVLDMAREQPVAFTDFAEYVKNKTKDLEILDTWNQ